MKSTLMKYLRMLRFALVIALKSWVRLTIVPIVGAFSATLKESHRIHAEIDDYLVKEFEEPRNPTR